MIIFLYLFDGSWESVPCGLGMGGRGCSFLYGVGCRLTDDGRLHGCSIPGGCGGGVGILARVEGDEVWGIEWICRELDGGFSV